MSSTTCETCKGYRTVCGRCGKPQVRESGDFSWGRCCYGARIKPCPKHVETSYACDVCLKPAPAVKWSDVAGKYRDACPACVAGWQHWLAVSADRFLETEGHLPDVDAMARAVATEQVRAVAFVAGFDRSLANKLAEHLYAATVKPAERRSREVTPSLFLAGGAA